MMKPGLGNTYRQKVAALGREQVGKLEANDDREGWDECSDVWLIARLREETKELAEACRQGRWSDVLEEAADVANFAMMLADNALRRAGETP